MPGLLGWLAGLAVGLLPLVGGRFRSFQPATFWAFLAAFLVYEIVAAIFGESLRSDKAQPPEVQGSGPIEPSTLPTVPTMSSSTESLQGDGSP